MPDLAQGGGEIVAGVGWEGLFVIDSEQSWHCYGAMARSLSPLGSLIGVVLLVGCGSSTLQDDEMCEARPETPSLALEGCEMVVASRSECGVAEHIEIYCVGDSERQNPIDLLVTDEALTLSVDNVDASRVFSSTAAGFAIESVSTGADTRQLSLASDAEGTMALAIIDADQELHYWQRSGVDSEWDKAVLASDVSQVRSFEFGPDGPLLWARQSSLYRFAHTGGEWSSQPVEGDVFDSRYGLARDGTELLFGTGGGEVTVKRDGELSVLGPGGSQAYYDPVGLPSPLAEAEPGPDAVVAVHNREGLYIVDDEGREVLISSAARIETPDCIPSGWNCNQTCRGEASGMGVQDFAAARTLSGEVWVAWVTREGEFEVGFGEECSEPDDPNSCACIEPRIEADHSVHTLHLGRLDPSGEFEETETWPIEHLDSTLDGSNQIVDRALRMRAHANRLVLAYAVNGEDASYHIHTFDLDELAGE